MRVLISGAGIAGPTLAYWLRRYGWTPILVERAPRFRTGGYIIDFWGAGFDVAEKMGLIPEITARGYRVREVRVVNAEGKRVAGFPADAFVRLTDGRFTSLPRGDLGASILNSIQGDVETIFGDSISSLHQTEKEVRVGFESGNERSFDLVVGADGLHSRVREIVFGEEARFEKYLGYSVAAFETAGYRPRDELVYVMFTEVGRQTARFTMRGDRTMFLLTLRHPRVDDVNTGSLAAQKAFLREHFGGSGWECPKILEALEAADDLYLDRVSQIRMNPGEGRWSRGRVTLVGDAAFCVSLLAGQGSALAMTAAYILAGELHRARGNHAEAFARYEQLVGPFVRNKQEAALRFAGAFAPKSRLSLVVRNQILNLLSIPWIADIAIGRDLTDRISLPEY